MMKELNYKNIPYLPTELVDIIVDYGDYEKYCKPQHYEQLKGVINDIGDMSSFQCIDKNLLSCCIARQCWGVNSHMLHNFEWDHSQEDNYEDNYDDDYDDDYDEYH